MKNAISGPLLIIGPLLSAGCSISSTDFLPGKGEEKMLVTTSPSIGRPYVAIGVVTATKVIPSDIATINDVLRKRVREEAPDADAVVAVDYDNYGTGIIATGTAVRFKD